MLVRLLGALSTVAVEHMGHQTHVSQVFIRRCLKLRVRDLTVMLTMMQPALLHAVEQITLSHSALQHQGKDN